MKPKTVVTFRETSGQINLQIKKPNLRYINEFVKLTVSPDFLLEKLFPNGKEITESFSAYNAFRKNLAWNYRYDDDKVKCIVIGDGHTPRTGATFAFRSKFQVISIDPNLRLQDCYSEEFHQRIKRLYLIKGKAEKVNWEKIINNAEFFVIAVHSHAPLDLIVSQMKKITKKTFYVISIPCCYTDNLDEYLIKSYEDWGIHSEKRIVNIYRVTNI